MSIPMENTGKLGFGLMRLPKKGLVIDVKQTSRMVDAFLEAGFTYFDTAYVYTGSEAATKKALVDRYPRESYTLATKLYGPATKSRKDGEEQFFTSLKRLGTEYVDYYLLHTLMEGNYRTYENNDLWDFALRQKELGRIRHVGFSFHDGPELLDKLLTDHPETEFVQLQINYADWENPEVTSRKNYEVARKHGKYITVMEPVKGGRLANPPREIKKIFDQVAPGRSPAAWAIGFVASLEGILSVLSGMSNMEQMEDNLSYMKGFVPFDEKEQAAIRQAQEILGKANTIPCTACSYCTKGCPMSIPIPDIFAAMNLRLGNGQLEAAGKAYEELNQKGNVADACIACGQCETVCPQHIEIIRRLQECREALEK